MKICLEQCAKIHLNRKALNKKPFSLLSKEIIFSWEPKNYKHLISYSPTEVKIPGNMPLSPSLKKKLSPYLLSAITALIVLTLKDREKMTLYLFRKPDRLKFIISLNG